MHCCIKHCFFGFKEANWLGYIQHINLFGFVSIPDMLNSIMLIKLKAATSMALSIMRVRMSFGVLTCHWSILPYCVMKIQEININYQSWLEISPRCGGISIYGRISHRGKELELTLVGFPTARLDFLPDTLVALDVAVDGDGDIF